MKRKFPNSLASNDYFDEMVMFPPALFEKMRQNGSLPLIRQSGGGKLNYEDDIMKAKTKYDVTRLPDDDDPRIDKLKKTYLIAQGDYATVYFFTRMRELQKTLALHLHKGKKLPAGATVSSVSQEIAKILKDYRDQFKKMLGKGETAQQPTPPTKKQKQKKGKKKTKFEHRSDSEEYETDDLLKTTDDEESEIEQETLANGDYKPYKYHSSTPKDSGFGETLEDADGFGTPLPPIGEGDEDDDGDDDIHFKQKGSGAFNGLPLFKRDKLWENVNLHR